MTSASACAMENLATAIWPGCKALETIRNDKLVRDTHARFEDYVTERRDSSERNAYQMIEEWFLAEGLNHAYGKPVGAFRDPSVPSSRSPAASAGRRDGSQLVTANPAQADGVRLTATITSQALPIPQRVERP